MNVPLVMLDETHHVILLRSLDQLLMVSKLLRCRFRDEDMQTALKGVQRNWVVRAWRREYE